MKIVFGMVSTRHSLEFTQLALESFSRTTTLEAGDRFVLIDNDRSLTDLTLPDFVKLRRNPEPKTFAQNMNSVLHLALDDSAAAILLNNDLVFTKNWLDPIRKEEISIISPLSNAEVPYEHGGLKCTFTMELEAYRGHEPDLEVIAEANKIRHTGFRNVHAFPFYCTFLPPAVLETVGFFDESYGAGGAEDKDYCIRALQAGYQIRYSLASFVLHFQGRSTWKGAEAPDETNARDEAYVARFREQWGDALARLFLANDLTLLQSPMLKGAWQAGQYKFVVEQLLKNRHIPSDEKEMS